MKEKRVIRLPEKLRQNILDLHSEKGARWLDDLPDLIAEISEKWSLFVKEPFPNLSYNYVAPCVRVDGAPAVLKIGFTEKDSILRGEAKFLRLLDGNGAVKLLQFDENACALLLERLMPGEDLKRICEIDDERATRIAAEVLRKIRRTPPKNVEFPSLETWTDSFCRATRPSFDAALMEKAQNYFAELIASSDERLLLHGDFHHQNILSARREMFLAIDPKGIVGDIGFEIAVFLNNPRGWLLSHPARQEILEKRVEIFAEAFALEPQNLRKWAFAEAVLSAWWTIEDGGAESEKWLAAPRFGKLKIMEKAQFGMVGLGTMGRNFLLNVAEHGFSCVGYDLDAEKRRLLVEEGAGMKIAAAENIGEFVGSMETPRKIMLLVPAGKIVDGVIENLLPYLDKGDIIIDGGNSHFTDTEVREKYLDDKGIEFLGVGVSGGEEGARHGASIMPGGKPEVYAHVQPILEAASAKVEGEPCVTYIGASSAGHFVKMVHNGIEYGLMQILAETYDFMFRVLKMNYSEMSQTFSKWNNSELNSFLVEITAEVLLKCDEETNKPLVEMILDKAAQKGTGKWTSQAAMDFGVPIPTIDSAVSMRQISAQKDVRILIAQKYGSQPAKVDASMPQDGQTVSSRLVTSPKAVRAEHEVETAVTELHKPQIEELAAQHLGQTVENVSDENKNADLREEFAGDFDRFVEELKNALLTSFIVTYAQGMSLLHTASAEKKYGLNLSEIAKIWRGGCIIRSALLEEMRRAFAENPDLPNLMLDDKFAEMLNANREDWRAVVEKFTDSRVPVLCLSSALAYFDAFRSERLPANLIQAQRDFFGAHTFQRIDKEGVFHMEHWDK